MAIPSDDFRAAHGDGQAFSYALQGANEAVFRAAGYGNANDIREAAAVYYQHALGLAALVDQHNGVEPPPWHAPEPPEAWPPRALHPPITR